MEKLILTFVLILFFNVVVIGQKYTYAGRLLDKDNNHPIEYGHIYLKGKSYGVLSDVDGSFSLSLATSRGTRTVVGMNFTLTTRCHPRMFVLDPINL